MATLQQCEGYGIDSRVCAEAVEKARAIAARAAPKTATLFDCEFRYAVCFEASPGAFAPSPSFCLKRSDSPEPSEVRYLEYVSDRQNRKKTQEVRID
jgi:uncharacterized protein YgiB involved in biofilm formation